MGLHRLNRFRVEQVEVAQSRGCLFLVIDASYDELDDPSVLWKGDSGHGATVLTRTTSGSSMSGETWTVRAGWLTEIDGQPRLVRKEVTFDYLPDAVEQISHPEIEDGQPMQVVSIGVPDRANRTIDIGLSRPLTWPSSR